MLTIRKDNNLHIAFVSNSKGKTIDVYIKETFNKDDPPELETSPQNKVQLFSDYLHNLKKPITKNEINELIKSYQLEKEPENMSLLRLFNQASNFVNESLKKYISYKDCNIIPKIKGSFGCMVVGSSGAGKSYFISQMIKANPPLSKEAGIFLIGPFGNDESYKAISKNIIHLNLDTFEEEYKVPFTVDCFPRGSILIMDDIESMSNSKDLEAIRDSLLSVRRHYDLTMYCVSHVSMAGHSTKKMLLECQYYTMYPSANWKHAEKLLKSYVGLDGEKINLIKNQSTRWCMVHKGFPSYFVTQSSIGLL